MTEMQLRAYLRECGGWDAPTWVTGHPAPDTDAAVSALFEAWRLTLSGMPAVPILQGALSRETAYLLGDLTFPSVTPASGKWVLTDHHDVDNYDGEVVAIVDHHPVADREKIAGIDADIRPVGAATTLVALRIRADGITPDSACARILLGAILLDTEGLSPHKARAEDLAAVEWLTTLCDEPPAAFYELLTEQLLSESDPAVLYERDLREYTTPDGAPLMRFAILKVRADCMPDRAAIRRRLAQDAEEGGYAATVAKIVLYAADHTREEIYLAAGPRADAVLDEVLAQSGVGAQRIAPDEVFLPAGCHHWGRKRYAVKLIEILHKKA